MSLSGGVCQPGEEFTKVDPELRVKHRDVRGGFLLAANR